ncbi:MAG: ankyrin repeat domain-containing protein [Wolbachia sp.]
MKLFPESRIDKENPSSQSSQERPMGDTESMVSTKEVRTNQKRKSKEKKPKKIEKKGRLMGIIRNDEINQFETMDIFQHDKQEMLTLALKYHNLYLAGYKGCTLKDPSLHIANCLTKDKELTFLHVAAKEGHVGVVALILQHGAHVNAKNEVGYTPLALALKYCHPEVVDLLLAALNINVGCIDLKSISSEGADKRKLVQKRVQDCKLFYKV